MSLLESDRGRKSIRGVSKSSTSADENVEKIIVRPKVVVSKEPSTNDKGLAAYEAYFTFTCADVLRDASTAAARSCVTSHWRSIGRSYLKIPWNTTSNKGGIMSVIIEKYRRMSAK